MLRRQRGNLLASAMRRSTRSLGMTWDEPCAQRVGISRPHAGKVIRLLEERRQCRDERLAAAGGGRGPAGGSGGLRRLAAGTRAALLDPVEALRQE